MHHLTAPALLAYLRRQALHLAAAPDGALHVWPASALDAATRAAIANHKRELLTLLAPNGADVLADERRCCRDCYHLQNKGNCAMAAQGLCKLGAKGLDPPLFGEGDGRHRGQLAVDHAGAGQQGRRQ